MSDSPSPLIPPAEMPAEEGWSPVDMPVANVLGRSFIHGDPEGTRMRVRLFVRDADQHLMAKVWYGPDAEGPPAHAHGGSMAAILDDLMGVSCWVAGYPVVAARITVNFRRKLPLGTIVTGEAWVREVNGKKVIAEGRLYHDDPLTPFSTSDGLFIRQSMESFQELTQTSHSEQVREHLNNISEREGN